MVFSVSYVATRGPNGCFTAVTTTTISSELRDRFTKGALLPPERFVGGDWRQAVCPTWELSAGATEWYFTPNSPKKPGNFYWGGIVWMLRQPAGEAKHSQIDRYVCKNINGIGPRILWKRHEDPILQCWPQQTWDMRNHLST